MNLNRAAKVRRHLAALYMSSGDKAIASKAQYHDQQNFSGVLPQGAYTVLLRVKMKEKLNATEQKIILAEYARNSCAEQGVIRCDVLFRVDKLGIAKDDFYDIWISFTDPRAYTEHERTSHAAKLRLCLEDPCGGDSSKLLTKLAHSVSLLRLVRPEITEWVSAFDFETQNAPPITEKVGGSLKVKDDPDRIRRSLDMLISSVGLEDVVVLVATASAFSIESTRSLRQECEEYLTDLERSPGIVRTGVLVDKNDPYRIIMMTVHDSSDRAGACFDMELASDYITYDGWTVRRCHAVFPDKVGWEKKLSEEDQRRFLGEVVEERFEQILEGPGALMKYDRGEAEDSKMRLLQGVGSFDMLKECIRSMTQISTGIIRTLLIGGWNQSRLHPLLIQIEYDKFRDPFEIRWRFGQAVGSTEIGTQLLRKALIDVTDFRPDVIVGYGGGTVMDMTKLLGRLGKASQSDLETYLNTIDGAAEADAPTIGLPITSPPIPVILIPTTVGSGAEMTEWCIVAGRRKNGSIRRLPLFFFDRPGTMRLVTEKTAIQESRLINPRRLSGPHASQGALELVCLAIDTLMGLQEHLNDQASQFAIRGLRQAYRVIMDARREPVNASGHSRDPLIEAKTLIGLASDGLGRPGVCVRLCLAVLDSLVDGRLPTAFREVLTRVSIATVEECVENRPEEGRRTFQEILKATNHNYKSQLVTDMLRKAEDCDVRLLPMMGMARRSIAEVAKRVSRYLESERLSPLEEYLKQTGVLERILWRAIGQEYEL
ncbi:bifunctional acetaldehyde-CoA/alcohol dehydrogenase [Gracilaria domingensis]|nr:bifunctional acetaldehyde-CoA/alcohol dehydrogenase [Gracilaria domingensis]